MHNRVFAAVILVLAGFCTGARAQHQVAEWISQERIGAWEDPLNWSTPQFPDNTGSNTYDVVLTNGWIISFHQSLSVNKCLLGGEPYSNKLYGLTGDTLTILDRFTWQGGNLSGWQVRYDCFGEVEIVTDVMKLLTEGSVLSLYGDTYWQGGDLDFTGYSAVWNLAGATFHVQTSRTIGDPGTTAASEFHNLGTVKTVGQGIDANFAVYFHHSGHLDVSNGLLRVTKQFDGPGSLYVGPGGRVEFRDRVTIGGNVITNLGSARRQFRGRRRRHPDP